jgi:phage baseplate assembly protein W
MQSTYSGLALPASRLNGGYFAAQPTKQRCYSDILMTAFTPIGSRPFLRTFGSGLPGLPFTNVQASVVNLVVGGALATWVPYVQLGSIQVGVPSVANQLPMKINYSVPNAV